MTSEAIRTASRELELGSSLSRFMAELGSRPPAATGGRFRASATRCIGLLERPSLRVGIWTRRGIMSPPARTCFSPTAFSFGGPRRFSPPRRRRHPPSRSPRTFSSSSSPHPCPSICGRVRVLKQSPLALDLYAWATRRVSYLERPTLISWDALRRSFGSGYSETPQGRACFRAKHSTPSGASAGCIPRCALRLKTAACCSFHPPRTFPDSPAELRRRLSPARGRRFSSRRLCLGNFHSARHCYRRSI